MGTDSIVWIATGRSVWVACGGLMCGCVVLWYLVWDVVGHVGLLAEGSWVAVVVRGRGRHN